MALVSPLLRLENNQCHIEESEYVLKKAHKYSELIILYEKKGLHQKGEPENQLFKTYEKKGRSAKGIRSLWSVLLQTSGHTPKTGSVCVSQRREHLEFTHVGRKV